MQVQQPQKFEGAPNSYKDYMLMATAGNAFNKDEKNSGWGWGAALGSLAVAAAPKIINWVNNLSNPTSNFGNRLIDTSRQFINIGKRMFGVGQ